MQAHYLTYKVPYLKYGQRKTLRLSLAFKLPDPCSRVVKRQGLKVDITKGRWVRTPELGVTVYKCLLK